MPRNTHLQSEIVSLQVSGVSRVVVNATNRLEGQVSGAATVEYLGNPTLAVTVSGGASVFPKQ